MERKKLKTLFLISEESDNFKESIQKIKEINQTKNDIMVLSLSISTSNELKKQNIKYKTPDNYFDGSNNSELNHKALKFAKNWYKPFESKLTYNGISLGEMLELDFYFLFIDALRSIEIANKIYHSELPELIYLPENLKLNEPNFICYETLPLAMQFLANKMNVKVKIEKGKKRISINFKSKINYFVLKYTFKFINIYQNFLFLLQNKKNMILFFGVYSYENITKKLWDEGYKTTKIYPISVKNRFTKQKAKEIEELYKKLENNEYLDINLEYKNVNLSFILSPRFKQVFKSKSSQLIELIGYIEQVIYKSSPSALITMEDVTPIKRTISKLFKIHNIPSIVIQHGITSNDMGGFVLMPLESNIQAIWGDNSYNWHSERGNKLQKITGNPSFDMIYKFKFDKKKIYSKLRLNPTEKIILITTGRFAGVEAKYTIEAEERNIRSTFKALKELENYQIIVKLHPAYQEIYNAMILNLAYEEHIDIKIFKDSLWDLLAISDILITFTSTTGLEAMLFNKPVLIIDLEYKEDMVGYGSSGAANIIYNEKDIIPSLENVLYNKKAAEKFANAREKFIYDSAYLLDGKSSERVANLIIDELKRNNDHH